MAKNNEQSHQSNHEMRLYNPVHFATFAPVFSLLFSGVLYSINLGQLEKPSKRNIYILLFIAVEAALVIAAIASSPLFGTNAKIAFEFINFLGGYSLYLAQRQQFAQWKKEGNIPRSLLAPILLAIPAVAAFLLLLGAIALASPRLTAHHYASESDTVYFKNPVTANDAKELWHDLAVFGLFGKRKSGYQVMLTEKHHRFVLDFPLKKKYLHTKQGKAAVEEIQATLSKDPRFDGRITVLQTDINFSPSR